LQVAKFKSLRSKNGQIDVNYRPVEPLNGRNLYIRSLNSNGAASAAPATLLLAAALLFFLGVA